MDSINEPINEALIRARAAGRRKVFAASVDHFGHGLKRISWLTGATQGGRYRYTAIRSCDLTAVNDAPISTAHALRLLNRLAKLGFVVRNPRPTGGMATFQFPVCEVDAWFDQAVAFYTKCGLSLTEMRQVDLPEIPRVTPLQQELERREGNVHV